ncbi:MAG: MSMEG_4193 family putative phosphomutase [Aggregatilineales bacterium]
MTQILLIRHAVNDYVKTGKLAGWTPEVHLNEEGRAQAAALAQRLAAEPLKHLYASPLERTMETAEAIRAHHSHLEIKQHVGIGEVRYGDWEGQSIAALRSRKMWHLVQEYPSRAAFPNGETMRAVQARAVDAVEAIAAAHPREMVAIVSHADLIKMIMAHYLGMHLDNFQRIVISPASINSLLLGYGRPYISALNDVGHLRELDHAKKTNQTAP